MPPQILEGTWEEITQHAAELSGHRVRVTVLDATTQASAAVTPQPSNGNASLNPQEETLDKALAGYVGKFSSGQRHNDAANVKEIWGEYLMEKDQNGGSANRDSL